MDLQFLHKLPLGLYHTILKILSLLVWVDEFKWLLCISLQFYFDFFGCSSTGSLFIRVKSDNRCIRKRFLEAICVAYVIHFGESVSCRARKNPPSFYFCKMNLWFKSIAFSGLIIQPKGLLSWAEFSIIEKHP